MKQIIFVASKNKHKIQEISEILNSVDFVLKSCSELGDISITEDGSTFIDNARKKLLPYLELSDEWVLADDSGLEVAALDNAPGVNSARYALAHDDNANNGKLLKELNDFDAGERQARFVCVMALGYRGEEVFSAEGTVDGYILKNHKGINGFGYDPLFFFPPGKKTLAEMSSEEKNRISHRAKALEKIRNFLCTYMESGKT